MNAPPRFPIKSRTLLPFLATEMMALNCQNWRVRLSTPKESIATLPFGADARIGQTCCFCSEAGFGGTRHVETTYN